MKCIPLKALIITGLLAINLCSCQNQNQNQNTLPPSDVPSPTPDLLQPSVTDEKTTVTVKALKCSFDFSKSAQKILIQDTAEKDSPVKETTIDGIPIHTAAFYLKINAICEPLFKIWKLEKLFNEDELKEYNPELVYLDSDGKQYTYALYIMPEAPAELTKEDTILYTSIRDNDAKTLKNSFQILP